MQNQRRFETTVDTVKRTIAKVQGPKYPFNTNKALHFADLRHEARKFYTTEIAKQPFTAINIVVYKRLFTTQQSQIGPRHLYNYASGELIKRVLLWCSEQHENDVDGDGTVQLVFSNRSALNCELLGKYYEQLFSVIPEIAPLISKHFRKTQVLALPHSKRAGLQVADAVASSFGKWLEENSYGQTEESYGRILWPIMRRAPNIEEGIVFIPTVVEGSIVLPDMQKEYDLLEKFKEKQASGRRIPPLIRRLSSAIPASRKTTIVSARMSAQSLCTVYQHFLNNLFGKCW